MKVLVDESLARKWNRITINWSIIGFKPSSLGTFAHEQNNISAIDGWVLVELGRHFETCKSRYSECENWFIWLNTRSWIAIAKASSIDIINALAWACFCSLLITHNSIYIYLIQPFSLLFPNDPTIITFMKLVLKKLYIVKIYWLWLAAY